jgi:hypothetical protein
MVQVIKMAIIITRILVVVKEGLQKLFVVVVVREEKPQAPGVP